MTGKRTEVIKSLLVIAQFWGKDKTLMLIQFEKDDVPKPNMPQ